MDKCYWFKPMAARYSWTSSPAFPQKLPVVSTFNHYSALNPLKFLGCSRIDPSESQQLQASKAMDILPQKTANQHCTGMYRQYKCKHVISKHSLA